VKIHKRNIYQVPHSICKHNNFHMHLPHFCVVMTLWFADSSSSSSSMALQPRVGPWPPLRVSCWYYDVGYQPHDRPGSSHPDSPPQTSNSEAGEPWVRNGHWILPTSIYHARRVLLHAANLWHGTDSFTSPATDFITLKIHHPRPDLNPRTLGPVASTLTTRPPRATRLIITTHIKTNFMKIC
jgi:hypothetical protein